jgi:hypothetical protein
MSGFRLSRLVELFGWLLLGIVSSIGFGVGIPTRVLFVYPHVLSVASALESPMAAWWECAPVVCVHAFGSALGELPPFVGSSMLVRRLKLDEGDNALAVSHRWFVERMRHHGFFWVAAMAAWPNIAFDMAGLAAGASGMRMVTFILAATTGKALLRAPVATALVVGSAHSIGWLPDLPIQTSSVSTLQTAWTVFVGIVSTACLWMCLREAAQEEMRRTPGARCTL